MKCQISYSRKIVTAQYENISINYSIEFDDEKRSPDQVFIECQRTVQDWLEIELTRLGIKRRRSKI